MFARDGPSKWIGHLDVMRAFERAFRIARVPVVLTQGFNPRPRIRFVVPSAVWVAAKADVLFADVQDAAGQEEALEASLSPTCLSAGLPDGLRVLHVEEIPSALRKTALHAYTMAVYHLTFSVQQQVPVESLAGVLKDLRGSERALAKNGDLGTEREVKLGDFLVDLWIQEVASPHITIGFTTRFGQSGTIRPTDMASLIVAAVPGLELEAMERVALLTADEAAKVRAVTGELIK